MTHYNVITRFIVFGDKVNMKRTPIIVPGQVYLNPEINDYLVVVKATRGDIQFRGPGFSGMNEAELFLARFQPVNVEDLTDKEKATLLTLLDKPGVPLSVGWVAPVDEDSDDFEEDVE